MAENNPLKVHNLRPAPGAKTAKTRVGRGEASKGKTAGRGTKGTKARYQVPERSRAADAPPHAPPEAEGLQEPAHKQFQVVNLAKLAELYPQGGEVTVADLVAKGAVRKNELVKVLGQGEISVAIQVRLTPFPGPPRRRSPLPAAPSPSSSRVRWFN